MRLTSPRFNTDHLLQLAADNSPPIQKGDVGQHVRHIQQALIDLGHPMPKSVAVHGSPDGDFGSETKEKVIEFQKEQKRRNPKFDVDGVVGEQTMGAFDRLLRTPITLPPIPGLGGATDEDGNLAESIKNVLSDSRLAKVSFTAMGVSISQGSYLSVRASMQAGAITARREPLPVGVSGVYIPQDAIGKDGVTVIVKANTFLLPFRTATTTAHKVTIVHEATHAFCDVTAVGSTGKAAFTRDQSESLAHIAQATFHRILTGGPEVDALTSDPTLGLNPVFNKADELAQEVLAGGGLTGSLLADLVGLVRTNRTASGLPNTTNFDGV